MDSWANDSFRDAIAHLAHSGRTDLASDLSRILDATDLSENEIFRSADVEDIARELVEVDTMNGLNAVLNRARIAFSVEHCTFHVVKEATANYFKTQVITTYPKDWIKRYLEANFQSIDPIMATCHEYCTSFYWDSIDISAPIVTAFMKEAKSFGIGAAGYTSITHTESGDIFGISVCCSENPLTFRERFDKVLSDFTTISAYMSDAFIAAAGVGDFDIARPSDDQLRVLRGIAEGMSWEELKAMEMCYGSFHTVSKSICKLFRSATLMQAAVQAARLGLIDSARLSENNIFSSSSLRGITQSSEPKDITSLKSYLNKCNTQINKDLSSA